MNILTCDGVSRGNPGHSGSAAILFDSEGKILSKTGKYIGVRTNNVAEYIALVLGLKLCVLKNIKQIDIRLDSNLIVNQINMKWKISDNNMKKYHSKCIKLLQNFDNYTVTHIPRHQNGIADSYANKKVDQYLKIK